MNLNDFNSDCETFLKGKNTVLKQYAYYWRPVFDYGINDMTVFCPV